MRERGENLPLGEKPPMHLLRVSARAQDFHRHSPAVLAIVALGEVYDTHAAAPELAQYAVRTDAPSFRGIARGQASGDRFIEDAVFPFVRREQKLDFPAQTSVVAAPFSEPRSSALDRNVERLLEHGFYRRAVAGERCGVRELGFRARRLGWAHDGCSSLSQRLSHARALTQSRRTVRVVTPSASAISASSRPPKNRHSTTCR